MHLQSNDQYLDRLLRCCSQLHRNLTGDAKPRTRAQRFATGDHRHEIGLGKGARKNPLAAFNAQFPGHRNRAQYQTGSLIYIPLAVMQLGIGKRQHAVLRRVLTDEFRRHRIIDPGIGIVRGNRAEARGRGPDDRPRESGLAAPPSRRRRQ